MALSDTTEIHQFTCLDDNFGVLIHDTDGGTTIAIDVPDADAYEKALEHYTRALAIRLASSNGNDRAVEAL